jgi:hypothetical protein
MQVREFILLDEASLEEGVLSDALSALWYDYHDDWDTAHACVQDGISPEASWVHAYLHRKEGDEGNARYWYAKAGKEFYSGSLPEEWERLVITLLERLFPQK